MLAWDTEARLRDLEYRSSEWGRRAKENEWKLGQLEQDILMLAAGGAGHHSSKDMTPPGPQPGPCGDPDPTIRYQQLIVGVWTNILDLTYDPTFDAWLGSRTVSIGGIITCASPPAFSTITRTEFWAAKRRNSSGDFYLQNANCFCNNGSNMPHSACGGSTPWVATGEFVGLEVNPPLPDPPLSPDFFHGAGYDLDNYFPDCVPGSGNLAQTLDRRLINIP